MTIRILNWLPIAAALAVPATGLAQDWTPTADRIVSDPTYLPLQGQLYGQSGYQYDSTNSTTYNGAGETSSGRVTSNLVDQYFAFGITNALSVNVGDSYEWTHSFVAPTGRSDYTRNANGFEDPTFGATYRLLDQRTQPVDLDLSASYAPDFIGARGASAIQDGNVARGGDDLGLRLAVGREMRFMTIQAYADATRYGRSSSFDGANSSEISSYWQPRVGIATQTRLGDRLSVNVGGEYDFAENYSQIASEDIANGIGAGQVDHGDFGNVNASLNYHFIPNRLVGSVVYSHTFYSPTNVAYIGDPMIDYGVQRSGDSVGAQLRYVFR